MVANDATLFRVRRITHDALFFRLRKYSPPPSADIEFPDCFEREQTLPAVNICRMKSRLGYKMGYKITWIPRDFIGCYGTAMKFNINKNNVL